MAKILIATIQVNFVLIHSATHIHLKFVFNFFVTDLPVKQLLYEILPLELYLTIDLSLQVHETLQPQSLPIYVNYTRSCVVHA